MNAKIETRSRSIVSHCLLHFIVSIGGGQKDQDFCAEYSETVKPSLTWTFQSREVTFEERTSNIVNIIDT